MGLLLAAVGAFAFDLALYRSLRRRSSAAGPLVDWLNPDNAPPSLMRPDDEPHVYSAAAGLPACKLCGGGRLHRIHSVEMVPISTVHCTVPGCPICAGGLN